MFTWIALWARTTSGADTRVETARNSSSARWRLAISFDLADTRVAQTLVFAVSTLVSRLD